jgi:hypothetical protein
MIPHIAKAAIESERDATPNNGSRPIEPTADARLPCCRVREATGRLADRERAGLQLMIFPPSIDGLHCLYQKQ